ncbi:MAG: MarR family winged helix-turn-helix transcriptional regulator [Pleomorphochaeta sp.]
MIYDQLAKELVKYQFVLLGVKTHNKGSLDIIRGKKRVIGYLTEIEDGIHPSKLCQFMGVSTARIATILKSLEKQNLITRKIYSSDKRKVVVNLTEKGKLLGLSYQKEIIADLSKLLEKLGESDAKEYVRLTKKVMHLSIEN